MTVLNKRKSAEKFLMLSTWLGALALFLNPLGFDIVQYQLMKLTGSLWNANGVLYCSAALFGILSVYFRNKYKKLHGKSSS